MSIPKIHVHTQVDKSTTQYAKFMWETMVSLANHPDSLQLTIHCMGPAAADRADNWIKQGNVIIVPDRKGNRLHGSYGHGACVMSALSMTGDGSIHIIADSDTVVVAKSWDDYLRKRLINDGISIVGSTYEDLGGFSSGAQSTQTYKKIPTVTWCALSPLHNWRTLNVLPNKAHKVSITNPQLSKIYNLPEGYAVFGEVAWQIPQYIHDNDLTYDGWRHLKPSKDAIVLKGLSDYHEEFHAEGVPFIAHHRGSMRHAYRGDKISKQFYSAVDAYLVDENTKPPRWEGLDTSVKVPVFEEANSSPVATVPVDTSQSYKPVGKEWIKITFNGTVIKARTRLDRSIPSSELEFEKPTVDNMCHLRIEGAVEHTYPIVIPQIQTRPYVLTCRNATGSSLMLTCGKAAVVNVPMAKTWLLLVDVDGVHHVE